MNHLPPVKMGQRVRSVGFGPIWLSWTISLFTSVMLRLPVSIYLLFLLPYRIDFHFLFILLLVFMVIPLFSILRETDEYQHTCEEWFKDGKAKEKCLSRNGKNDSWDYSMSVLMAAKSVCPAQIFPPSFRPIEPSKVSSFLYLETAQTLQTQPMKVEFSHLCSGLPHLCFSLPSPTKTRL